MARSIAHRYSIEIKDTETGTTLVDAAVDWTDDQKQLAVIVISRLANPRGGDRFEVLGSFEGRPSKDRWH